MSERHRKEADSYSRQVKELQAQVEPLKRQANKLQAHVESHREEIRIVRTCFLSTAYVVVCSGMYCVSSHSMLGKHLWGLPSAHTIIVPLCCQCHILCAADRCCVSNNISQGNKYGCV